MAVGSKHHLQIVPPATDAAASPLVQIEGFGALHRETRILKNISCVLPEAGITCIVGPSGSGKSTLLRSINRINDETPGFRAEGVIRFRGQNIYTAYKDVTRLRAAIGMVFQKPCVFPVSIRENVLFGIAKARRLSKIDKADLVERTLRAAALWTEVEHRLEAPAGTLSLGQQQRLCMARALAMDPEILLLDEPTASVDPVSGRAIEEMLVSLKAKYSLVLVTHDLQQMKRIADHIIFLCEGRVIEAGPAQTLMTHPQMAQTQTYLAERFCDC